MKSKFKGTCKNCGGAIAVGEEIFYSKETGALHIACKLKDQDDDDEKQLQEDIKRGITPLENSPF